MFHKKTAVIGLSVLSSLYSVSSSAYDADAISINGFGSIIAGQTLDSDEALYSYDEDISFQEESRFAIQVAAPIGEKFSATAQIMARGRDDFDPQFEWAYVSYQATENVIVMAGRQRFNLYKYSDYLDVGYAYHWIRPPQGVYSVPFNSGNGLGFLYHESFDEFDFQASYKMLAESISDYVPSGTDGIQPAKFEAKLSHLINLDFTRDSFNFGLNFALVPDLSYEAVELVSLEAALNSGLTPAQVEAIMKDVRINNEKAQFYGGYIGYDTGDWFLLSEYTKYEFDEANAFSDQESVYLSAGIRINEFTFHASYGRDKNKPTSKADQLVPDPTLAAAVKQAITSQQEDSNSYSIGARWEVEGGVALKVDYTSLNDDHDDSSDADMVSMGIDFVY